MNLVVYSNKKIKTLLKNIKIMFSAIPNRKLHLTRNITNQPPFHQHKERLFLFKIKEFQFHMYIIWPTKSLRKYRSLQIDDLMRYHLENAGQGSLIRNLQNRVLATNIRTAVERTYSYDFFYLIIELTEEGVVKSGDVIKTVFDFISVLKNMKKTLCKTYWRNYLSVKEVYKYYMLNTYPFNLMQ